MRLCVLSVLLLGLCVIDLLSSPIRALYKQKQACPSLQTAAHAPRSSSPLASLQSAESATKLQRRETGGGREEEMAGCDGAKSPASMEEEACAEKKYGGIAPKKPLISKDHERAYFDSADWVLGKQAANSSTRAAVESLKPKMKRTPHHQLPPRKPTCASG